MLYNCVNKDCYENPVLEMDYSDPDVIRVGEDYYLVSSSFTYLPGVPLLHSRDLIHWEQLSWCLPRLPFARYDLPAHGCGSWAPSIRYHEGRFYVFIPLPDEGIFVVTATDRAGKSTSVTRNVEVNTTAPKITAVEIVPNPADAGATYIIKVTVE